jgi:limonene-1,2-epoxide hydrolase
MNPEAEAIVNRFMAAWTRRNLDELSSFFTDDIVCHNIPMAPARGLAELRALFASFLDAADTIEIRVLNSASSGNFVFNERIDVFTRGPNRRLELPVAGVFELRDGRIARWREYFDLASWQSLTR